jgi:predicted RNase H-like HicB family nuclease
MAESSRYPIEIFYSEEDGGFIAIAKDLPGCSAFGKTAVEAAKEIQDAVKAWREAAEAAGNPIPEPSRHVEDASLPSGKILLRVPRTLHAALIECARKESVSLNQHLVSVLSVSIGRSLFWEVKTMAEPRQREGVYFLALTPTGRWSTLSETHFTIPPTYSQSFVETVFKTTEDLDVKRLPVGVPILLEGR